jgi:multidrug efflux pump subunit AcrA (membrane-fusion protein)
LTAEAARLLGVRTERVRSEGAAGHTVIPHDAVLYDADGGTWTYTSPNPLVYQRADIRVARIDGVSAILTRGPPAGTRVVTAGATEIWGVEYGDIEED